jgi:cytochrome c-type biogenesis protein CcsB
VIYVLAEHPWFLAATGAYAAAAAAYAATWRSTRTLVGRLATATMCAAISLNGALIAGRWIAAGRPPFKTMFESLVFFSFTTGAVYLVMERLHRTRVFGAFAALTSLACLAYAVARWDAEIVRLPPALQSAWFVPHVVVYFVGYAAMAFATGAAVLQLLAARSPFFARLTRVKAGTALCGTIDLEQVTFDAIGFGFVLLTVGLLVGSVWAKSAWGDFWVWDPKESWSLVTWLVYGAYLHLRRVKGWRGERAAWVAIAGFAVVLFTYVGMGLLPSAEESVHVYTQSRAEPR